MGHPVQCKLHQKAQQQQKTDEPSKINVYSLGFEEPEDGLEGSKGRMMMKARDELYKNKSSRKTDSQ